MNTAPPDVLTSLFGSAITFLDATLTASKSCVDKKLSNAPAVLQDGTQVMLWDVGVLYFKPSNHQDADSILLSAGVHGNETAPIEIVDALVSDILAGTLSVRQNLLVVLANPPAINRQVRFIEENMNRLFHNTSVSSNAGNYEQARALRLMEHSARFFQLAKQRRFHYDLHTAIRDSQFKQFAISPNIIDSMVLDEGLGFLQHCGIESVLLTEKKSATYSAVTARQYKAISFTVELGKAKPFGENTLSDFSAAEQGLRALIRGEPLNQAKQSKLLFFSVAYEVIKLTDNFRLCFAKNTANFTQFDVGDILASDQNYQYRVKLPGERIVFPNQDVAIGQRALVIVRPIQP